MARRSDEAGAKLGTRIAHLVSLAVADTHRRLLDTKHKLAMKVFTDASDMISEEFHRSTGRILRDLAANPKASDRAKAMLNELGYVQGQQTALAGSIMSGLGITGAVAAVMNNELAPLVYGDIATNPHLIPDAGTIAQMAALNLISNTAAEDAIISNGYSLDWASNMITIASSFPETTEVVELLRRQVIQEGEARELLQYNGYSEDMQTLLLALVETPLSPADAALAVLRGNLDQAAGEAIAAEAGLSPASFQTMIDNTGEPPGLMQMLEAYRRGIIDQGTLEKGIRESRVRDEWISMVEALRYVPMSTADAVNAEVQGYLSASDVESIATQNGLEPGQSAILIETAGEPLSRTELEDLYNRGLIDKATVIQGLRESRLKNKYNDDAFELHTKLLPTYTVTEMLKEGSITDEAALTNFLDYGYSEADSAALVAYGKAQKVAKTKNLTLGVIESLYEYNGIDVAEATAMLTNLGYTTGEAEYILEVVQLKAAEKLSNQITASVRTRYIAWKIDDKTALGMLNSGGVPAKQAANLIAAWTIERSVNVRTLTEAQIIAAMKISIYTPDQALDRLMKLGYSQDDGETLIMTAAKVTTWQALFPTSSTASNQQPNSTPSS